MCAGVGLVSGVFGLCFMVATMGGGGDGGGRGHEDAEVEGSSSSSSKGGRHATKRQQGGSLAELAGDDADEQTKD
jgi:hypothetical protein